MMLREFLLILSLLSVNLQAHVVTDSKYVLNCDEDYRLSIQLKTSAIHQKIVALYPNMKGRNLNSSEFQKKVFAYLNDCLSFKNKEAAILLKGERVSAGGHYTQVEMQLIEVSNSLENLSISIKCFTESKQHTANVISIISDGKQYGYTLSEAFKSIHFDFSSKQFLESSTESKGKQAFKCEYGLSIVFGLVLLIVFVRYFF